MAINFCLCLVVIFTLLQSAQALHVDITPNPYNEILTDEITITCTYDSSIPTVQQIVMLELGKENKVPLVVIREKTLSKGNGMQPFMKAEGSIKNNGSASSGYVKLSIQTPRTEDEGVYECLLFYMNELFQLKQVRAQASAAVDRQDLKSVVTQLARKVSRMDKTTKEQADVISRQGVEIDEQRKIIKEQQMLIQDNNMKDNCTANVDVTVLQKQIKEQIMDVMMNSKPTDSNCNCKATTKTVTQLQGIVSKLDKRVNQQKIDALRQETKLDDQEKLINQQNGLLTKYQGQQDVQDHRLNTIEGRVKEQDNNDQNTKGRVDNLQESVSTQSSKLHEQILRLGRYEFLIKEHNASIAECKKRLDSQEKQIKEEVVHIIKETGSGTNSSFMSVFSYGYDPTDTFDEGRVILFTDKLFTVGSDYNPKTGIFTAPRQGIYVFNMVVTTASADWSVEIDLRVNKKTVASLHALDEDHWDQSSINTIVSLKAGDEVKPVVTYKHTGNTVVAKDRFSYFNGYLLKLT